MRALVIVAVIVITAQNGDNGSRPYNLGVKDKEDVENKEDDKEDGNATVNASKNKTRKSVNNAIPGLLIPVTFILSMSCFVLNIFVSSYYKREKAKHIVSWLYFATSVVDIITSVGIFLLGVVLTYYYTNTKQSRVISVIIYISTLMTGVGIRTCVFLNVTLTTIRTIYISRPFYTVRKTLVIGSLIIFCIAWTLVGLYDIYYTIFDAEIFDLSRYLTKGIVLRPFLGFTISEQIIEKATNSDISYAEQIFIAQTPFLIACIIFFVCLVAQMYALLSAARERPHTKEFYKSATTILILTVIFVICNTMATVLWLYVYSDSLKTRQGLFKPSPTEHALIYTSGTICNILSSLLMSVTLIVRSTDLKRYILFTMCRNVSKHGKGELMLSKGVTLSTIKSTGVNVGSTQATV